MENETGYPLIIYNVKINNLKTIFPNQKKGAGFNMILEIENRWPLDDWTPGLFMEKETGYPLLIYNVKINNFS